MLPKARDAFAPKNTSHALELATEVRREFPSPNPRLSRASVRRTPRAAATPRLGAFSVDVAGKK